MQLAHGLLGQPTFEHGQLVDKVHAFVAHPGSTWQVETKQGVQAIGKKMHRRASRFATLPLLRILVALLRRAGRSAPGRAAGFPGASAERLGLVEALIR